jgi:putative flippase GtrA
VRGVAALARRWTTFNLVGAAGAAVQIGMIAYLAGVCGWHYLPATAAAVEGAVVHNFAWHHWWTWKDRPAASWHSVAARFARFQALNGVVSLAGNLVVVKVLSGSFGTDPVVANVVAIAACALVNFALSEAVVFRTAPAVPAAALVLVLVLGAPAAAAAQTPAAVSGWERYQSTLDARYRSDESPGRFFVHDRDRDHQGWRETVRTGTVSLFQVEAPAVADSSIHQWAGAAFIPGMSVADVVRRVRMQAGHEAGVYDGVVASKLLAQDGDRLRVFMQLRRTTLITVTYNTEHAVEYRRVGDTRFSARSNATRIAELADAGTAREREKTPAEDSGFLWRLAAYWRYEQWDGGVLVECESVSLSRTVPLLLRPIAAPIVDRIARESLERTLRSLRTQVMKGTQQAEGASAVSANQRRIFTSKSLGQSLPVTNSRSLAASYAMPFMTSTPRASAGLSSPLKSIQPVTRPVRGLIRAMRSVCHTLASTSPLTNSSSFRCSTGVPPSRTWMCPVSRCVTGSKKRRLAVPSLMINRFASWVRPQPSPV